MIKVAVLGYGTVGSGVVEVLATNQELIAKRVGEEIYVKYILDLREFPGDPYEDRVVHDVNVILNDPEIAVISETMGGNEPAYTFSKKALMAGKSVVTSNKELVANHGPELIALAKANNCSYLFEASVGGGIPVIRPINNALTAERIVEITGILNGTTNYILTKMAKEGAEFEDVLKEAQEKGYAERNPEADVEGYDACRKIAILSSLMTGKTVHFEDIYTEGITKITSVDFEYAKKLGKVIKLLANSRESKAGYIASVAPMLIGSENPLCSVDDVFNAICVEGNTLGQSMFYGKGAGKLPTASAVVGDIIECAKNIGKHLTCLWEEESVELQKFEEAKNSFFVRTNASDKALAEELFGEISDCSLEKYPQEFAFTTGLMSEKEFAEKAAKLPGFITRIRIKD